jgi:hypothetical protein
VMIGRSPRAANTGGENTRDVATGVPMAFGSSSSQLIPQQRASASVGAPFVWLTNLPLRPWEDAAILAKLDTALRAYSARWMTANRKVRELG